MSDDKKTKNKINRNILKESIVGGEGISEIEEKRQKFEEKHSTEYFISPEEQKSIYKEIKKDIEIVIETKDLLIFLLAQFLPLILISSACFIPGIIFLSVSLYLLILVILGGLGYLYSMVRFICTLTYKVKITSEKIEWRNCFWWQVIPNKEIQEVNPVNSNYFYFTKIGGIGRIGVEIIGIKTKDKEFWLRVYPLRKERGDYLVKIIKCWAGKVD